MLQIRLIITMSDCQRPFWNASLMTWHIKLY